MAEDVGYFVGSAGVVHVLALPLSEVMAYQVTRNQLKRVNADGSPYDANSAMDLTSGRYRRPGQNAPKNEWVGYAVSQGMRLDDADAMTKADLVDKYARD